MRAIRIFLTGAAVGLITGIILGPVLTRSDFVGGAVGEAVNGMLAIAQPKPPVATWPTGEEALTALFNFSNWSAENAKAQSSATVDDCLGVEADMTCKLTLDLSWMETTAKAEAVFHKSFDRWSMVSIKGTKAR